jgi:hypothetical protein
MLHLGIQGVIAHGPGAIEDFPRNLTAPLEREGYTWATPGLPISLGSHTSTT